MISDDERVQRECWRVIEIGRLRGIKKFISEREKLIVRVIAVKICGKVPLLYLCSEIWHAVVESTLRNVKLLEEKRLQQILD